MPCKCVSGIAGLLVSPLLAISMTGLDSVQSLLKVLQVMSALHNATCTAVVSLVLGSSFTVVPNCLPVGPSASKQYFPAAQCMIWLTLCFALQTWYCLPLLTVLRLAVSQ